MTTYLSIGEFSQRTRLSPKALRLYGELGLLPPARVDPDSGYRFYREDQIEPARLIGLLRRLDMPLATIRELLPLDGAEAARRSPSGGTASRPSAPNAASLVAYLRARLRGEEQTMYDIKVRRMPERPLVSINRHVDASGTGAFFDEAFSRLRAAGPGLEGIEGVPFLVFYGEVSEDSDGPIELCRPVDGAAAASERTATSSTASRRLTTRPISVSTLKEMGWPALLPACDALERWTKENGREPAGRAPPAPDRRSAHRYARHARLRPQRALAVSARRVRLRSPLELGPGVLEAERAVEDEPPGRRVGIRAEVAEALELHGLADRQLGERRLDQALRRAPSPSRG